MIHSKHISHILFLALMTCLFSCKKDIPPQKPQEKVSAGGYGKAFVLNEGNFMAANASITQLDLSNGAVTGNIYASANNNAQLGDVCQSMYEHNSKYYIVLNNSSKIQIVTKNNFTVTSSINGLTSPRYFLPVSNNKAYVTDLYANAVSIVDLVSNTKTGSIAINGWTEELVSVYGNVFVTNKKTNYLYVIDAASDVLTDSISVGYGSTSVCEDKNGKLWVLCSGSTSNGQLAKLCRINPLTKTVDTTFTFSSTSNSPYKLRINGNKDQLYWIDYNGIYTMNINGNLNQLPLIAQGTKTFYGLGIDPDNGTIYVADAIDYNQNGKIYRYDTSGNQIDNFTAGIIPGDFFFEK